MKTAVARSESNGQAIFNEEMLRFANHYQFQPKACQPYRAKTKGKVERAVSYLRHNFFYGRSFHDIEDLNSQLRKWLLESANNRLHGTTNEVPDEQLKLEAPHLKPLPADSYVPIVSLGRRMSRDGYVSYNGNDYSIPEGLGRVEIEVQASLDEVRLYQNDNLLAVHPVLEGRGERRLALGHRRYVKPAWRSDKLLVDNMTDYIEVQRRPLEVYEEVLR